MKPISLAVVGLGWWGQRLVSSVQGKSDKVRFVAATAANPERRASLASDLGMEIRPSLQSLCELDGLDGIVIATPHSLHSQQIEAGAAAGKHVFCEKPLALSVREAEDAISACRVAGVTLAVGHNRRFAPNIVELTRIVRSGELGKLLHVEAHWSNDNTLRADFGAWRNSPRESPGASMTGTGVHALDIMTSLFGRSSRVHVQYCEHQSDDAAILDSLSALMEFEGGVSGLLTTIRSTPRYWRVHVFGIGGSVEARGDEELRVYRSGCAPEIDHLPACDTVRLELEAFADAIRGEKAYPVTADDLINSTGAFEQIVASCEHRLGTR